MKQSLSLTPLAFYLVTIFFAASAAAQVESPLVTVELSSPTAEYRLGEIVPIRFSVRNHTRTTLELGGDANSWTSIEIADGEGKDFNAYAGGPIRGFTIDGYNMGEMVEPATAKTWYRTLLWNHKPEVSHLSSPAAEREARGRILRDSAFPIAGTYVIRLRTHVELEGRSADNFTEPYRLTITDPAKSESVVWQAIRDDGDFLYLMQYGDLWKKSYSEDDRERLVAKIRLYLNEYPEGPQSENLRRGLLLAENRPKSGHDKAVVDLLLLNVRPRPAEKNILEISKP